MIHCDPMPQPWWPATDGATAAKMGEGVLPVRVGQGVWQVLLTYFAQPVAIDLKTQNIRSLPAFAVSITNPISVLGHRLEMGLFVGIGIVFAVLAHPELDALAVLFSIFGYLPKDAIFVFLVAPLSVGRDLLLVLLIIERLALLYLFGILPDILALFSVFTHSANQITNGEFTNRLGCLASATCFFGQLLIQSFLKGKPAFSATAQLAYGFGDIIGVASKCRLADGANEVRHKKSLVFVADRCYLGSLHQAKNKGLSPKYIPAISVRQTA